MSEVAIDVVAEVPAEVKGPKTKVKKATKTARPKASHPSTAVMVQTAITELKERGGSSLRAIKKYISTTYKLDGDKFGRFIKKYIKESTASGILLQTKGKGASGSFKLATAAVTKTSTSPKPKKVSAKSKFEKKTPSKAKPKAKFVKTSAKPAKKIASKSVSKSIKKTKLPVKPKAPKPKSTKAISKK